MKNVRKNIRFIGWLFFLMLVLSACANSSHSNPDGTLKNYFTSVQDMEFEESYEFMHGDLGNQFKAKMGENPDEDVPEEVKNLKSYQEYTSEVAKLYKKIDYEIIDRTDYEFTQEYVMQVTVPNIDKITENAAVNFIGSLFSALFTGEIDSEAYDELYTDLVEDMRSEDINEEIIEGVMTIEPYEADGDSGETVWLITRMDENIFNALTFMNSSNDTEGSGGLVIDDANQTPTFDDNEEQKFEPEDVDEASRKQARDNLERTDQTLEEKAEVDAQELDQLHQDLAELFALYAEDREWDGNYYASREFSNTIAGRTSVPMSQQLDIAMKLVGYEVDLDTAEWYESDTQGVYQFLVSVKAEGYDDLVFSGNYNKEDRMFSVFKMHGILDLDEFAS